MIILGLDFPDSLHYRIEDQVWARVESDGSAVVGITSLGIRLAGEIYMCRPKPPGSPVAQGRSVAVVELAKSIVSVRSPVSGDVLTVNPRLAREPERIHLDPYGEGWIARLALRDWANDLAGLLQGEAVGPAMRHHAWLNGFEA
ncbi:MAG: glycine cleavage system protein H [Burkholderiales bacterium]